jgi:hypothetical protein
MYRVWLVEVFNAGACGLLECSMPAIPLAIREEKPARYHPHGLGS